MKLLFVGKVKDLGAFLKSVEKSQQRGLPLTVFETEDSCGVGELNGVQEVPEKGMVSIR